MVRMNRGLDLDAGLSPAGWKILGETVDSRPQMISFEVDAETAARLSRHVAMLKQLAPGGAWDADRAALNLMMSALERVDGVGREPRGFKPPAA